MSPTALAAREEVLAVLAAALPQLRALGVSDVRLFGSVARGDSRPESDVDVLVHFGDTPSFSQYLAVSDLLTTVLRRPVDVVMDTAVKPRFRQAIEREALRVA